MTAERKETTSSASAPPDDYRLHRVVNGAVDVGPYQDKGKGMVMDAHSEALIQVCPEGGANPTAKVLFWSEGANAGNGAFIEEHTAIAFAAKGVNVPWEARVPCSGRRMFVAVEAGVAGGQQVRVYVAGYNDNLGR